MWRLRVMHRRGERRLSKHLDRAGVRVGEAVPWPLGKRLLDIVIAVPLLVAFTPLMLMLALAIKLGSRGPVLYRCSRVGLGGREFPMLKFRKMRPDAAGPPLTCARDERFTRLGSFLAQTKLDELPQLWNVIRGDMSLVGPRPEDAGFIALYSHEYTEVLRARPGITGLSQLAFAREGRLLVCPDRVRRYVERLLPQKVALDQLYVAQRSTSMDLRILAWTVITVLLGIEVSVDRRSGKLSVRRRRLHADPAPAMPEDART
jgi:lipopolysaccharide/colanic/teichoic acid biosynthesis glycosyltransferase